MRVPEGAPTAGWLKWQQKFPGLKSVSRPPLGTVAVISTVVLTIFGIYAVAVEPKINNEYYKQSQAEKRALIDKTREQLANGLRPWSDPFDRK